MTPESFFDGRVTLMKGDSRDVLGIMSDASIDAIVSDPPYGLAFMGKHWDAADTVAFAPAFWRECLRVLKPGGHVVAFGGTRTYHRLVCAIEDAGFEIRDQLAWLFGSGFPKSHNVAKAIEGDLAREWQGWGTALKPAHEPIVLARKPLIGTVAANVLAHGTGGINVDGCRVEGPIDSGWAKSGSKASENVAMSGANYAREPKPDNTLGRHPANVIHDGSDEVLGAFPATASGSGAVKRESSNGYQGNALGKESRPAGAIMASYGDSGSAARFFYSAKADADDRIASKHPTVKPVDLMQWLVRLVTPKGGVVLDPFAGTGTTGEAAWREGMRAVLIEREAEYQADIARRMELAASPMKPRAVTKSKGKLSGATGTPLFGDGGEA